MSRMTYMRSWKSLRLTSHTWLGLNPQIERPLSRIVVPLIYFLGVMSNERADRLAGEAVQGNTEFAAPVRSSDFQPLLIVRM
jgi:hypothetical protein